ncbi:2-oxoacid:acceptor oxidoreductase family protein [Nanchangia anserum]|uniref:2-oxoacid:acceptor oxidoreductase family protein n=1 Tax=Nanchangia anserum TaxID=2692125 RepID=A0A8I0KRQ9_9ACTO|nr:2-oxoacid:acceptor oxidoreductase family protein [Nanchangia anserum]MBD3689647.1 2-oxoacid:acceptor oxidoreductase family protein [Nanchangia anserum]QOX81829.1 2-oxoacid:acceptor oxidoreductase family protein [Nanchangia anserum]
MTEVRIHGRGGQGVVTASDLIAYAAFTDGHHAQAFPSFGSERTGAPVVSYCRITDTEIRTREPVLTPDLVVVQDPTLLPIMDVFSGLAADGYALVNSAKTPTELGIDDVIEAHKPGHIITLPATELAKTYLGRPLPNAVMLGGAAALTGLVRLESVEKAIRQKFAGVIGERNVEAASAAFDYVNDMIAASNEKESARA